MGEPKPSPQPASAVDDAVQSARLDMVFGSQPAALIVSMILAGVTVAVMHSAGSVDTVGLYAWLGVLLAVSVLRGWLYWAYRDRHRHGRLDSPAGLRVWESRFHYGCTIAGLGWGSSALLFFPGDVALQAFLAFVLAGVSAGATTELAVMPRTAHAFVIPCVLPLAARFFMLADGLHAAMGLMAFLYVGLLVTAGRRSQTQLKQTVAAQLDASASKRALDDSEANLRDSEERLRLAIEAGRIGVWDWDIPNNVLLWDRRMYEMYNIAEQARSNNYEMWRQRIHPEDLGVFEAEVNHAVTAGDKLDQEFRIVWPDGQERTIKSLATVVRVPEHAAQRMTGINLDITELKRVERMKSEFISTVSHELRTPLTSIRGSLGLLASDAAQLFSPQKTQELLNMAARNAEHLMHLIENLLDIEKIESRRMRFEMKPEPLTSLIEQAIADNSAYAAARNVTLRVKEGAPQAMVTVDAKRCLQVMANLLSNAVKFSPSGGQVEVAVLKNADRVRVEVRDRGRGIPVQFRSKVFEKFSQADGSDTRLQGGTGLSLAISKAMIEQMHGTIGFESQIEIGTTFYFELPAFPEMSGAQAVASSMR